MKLDEILQPRQLDEINLKQAVAAGMIGAAALAPKNTTQPEVPHDVVHQTYHKPQAEPKVEPKVDPKRQALIQLITKTYNVDPELAKGTVDAAYKYQYADFPTAKDILAIVGIESSFDPTAKSQLKNDPARGLMQVRPNVWGIDADELHDIERNIEHGARILNYYYKKFGRNKEAAIQAYNVGETKFRAGTGNQRYLDKFSQERDRYKPISSL